MLFVNADDLGCSQKITNSIINCYAKERIHTTSAMVFMADSERAAGLAKTNQLLTGLHLNFDQELTARNVPAKLLEHHRAVLRYLKKWKWNQVIYNPFLYKSFDYVFQAQWDEFEKLYGEMPIKLDGHHHMHLCMNMLFSGKIPKSIKIRRNFSFRGGEKHQINRLYRYLVDCFLASNFICTDFFFSLTPIDIQRIKQIISISKSKDVEIMVHPGVDSECLFLLSPVWASLISDIL